MKIYNFCNSLDDALELKKLIIEFYEITYFLHESYPGYKDWFSKHIIGCFKNERTILYTKDNDKISGLIFLKKDSEESKICTIYVLPEYRNMNIATKLIEASFEYLGTSKPLATVNSSRLKMFSNMINRYGWEITDEIKNLYNEGETEVVLNRKRK